VFGQSLDRNSLICTQLADRCFPRSPPSTTCPVRTSRPAPVLHASSLTDWGTTLFLTSTYPWHKSTRSLPQALSRRPLLLSSPTNAQSPSLLPSPPAPPLPRPPQSGHPVNFRRSAPSAGHSQSHQEQPIRMLVLFQPQYKCIFIYDHTRPVSPLFE